MFVLEDSALSDSDSRYFDKSPVKLAVITTCMTLWRNTTLNYETTTWIVKGILEGLQWRVIL